LLPYAETRDSRSGWKNPAILQPMKMPKLLWMRRLKRPKIWR
jgi:hypothetical protein